MKVLKLQFLGQSQISIAALQTCPIQIRTELVFLDKKSRQKASLYIDQRAVSCHARQDK